MGNTAYKIEISWDEMSKGRAFEGIEENLITDAS